MSFNLIDTIKGVATGVFNSVFVKEQIEKMAEERISSCRGCKYNSEVAKKNGQVITRPDEHCLVCGCNLHLKTRYPSAHCPLGDPGYGEEIENQKPLWVSLATNEESERILKMLDNNK